MKFMLITNDVKAALNAEKSGVSRIFVDLEKLGKHERQGHLDTLISSHSILDVAKMKSVLSTAELLVRVNPINEGSEKEVEDAILSGADILMLPMFHSEEEVQYFSSLIRGRVKFIPLIETFSAVQAIKKIVEISGVSEVYIGLNDLHLDMKLNFMFEPVANGLIDEMADVILNANMPFGFGGIARVGEGVIPGELIMAEHLRLKSSSVILSRTFNRGIGFNEDSNPELYFESELKKLVRVMDTLQKRSKLQIDADQRRFQELVNSFVKSRQ